MIDKSYITYYLGAGASANAIPVVGQLNQRLNDLSEFLKRFTTVNEAALNTFHSHIKNYQKELNQLISDIDWLINELTDTEYDTIDVLAKRLYLNEDPKLNTLKMVLLFYFYFEQVLEIPSNDLSKQKFSKKIDPRYDNLISHISTRKNGEIYLNEFVKILTWNYDLQIDLSIKKLTYKTIQDVKVNYNIYPNINTYNLTDSLKLKTESFCTLKLNGNAFLDTTKMDDGLNHQLFNEDSKDEQTLIANALLVYISMFSRRNNKIVDQFKYFNFSWEEEGKYTGFEKTLSSAKDIALKTKILIVCGYSFPPYNNSIDKEILGLMWPEEIHIQDEYPEDIENRIRALVPNFNRSGDKQNPKINFIHSKPSSLFPHPPTLL